MKWLLFFKYAYPIVWKIYYIYFKKIFGFRTNVNDFYLISVAHILVKYKLILIENNTYLYKIKISNDVYVFVRKNVISDFDVIKQIWLDGELNFIIDYWLGQKPIKRLRIVDAGANIGMSSIYLNEKLKSNSSLDFIVIEPDEDNMNLLLENFKLNNINNYHIERAGLFTEKCYLNLVGDFRGGDKWAIRTEKSDLETKLKSVELNDLFLKYNMDKIDFLKMDIEGSEKYIFQDRNYILGILEKVSCIAIEPHTEYIDPSMITSILVDAKFTITHAGEYIVGYK